MISKKIEEIFNNLLTNFIAEVTIYIIIYRLNFDENYLNVSKIRFLIKTIKIEKFELQPKLLWHTLDSLSIAKAESICKMRNSF